MTNTIKRVKYGKISSRVKITSTDTKYGYRKSVQRDETLLGKNAQNQKGFVEQLIYLF